MFAYIHIFWTLCIISLNIERKIPILHKIIFSLKSSCSFWILKNPKKIPLPPPYKANFCLLNFYAVIPVGCKYIRVGENAHKYTSNHLILQRENAHNYPSNHLILQKENSHNYPSNHLILQKENSQNYPSNNLILQRESAHKYPSNHLILQKKTLTNTSPIISFYKK